MVILARVDSSKNPLSLERKLYDILLQKNPSLQLPAQVSPYMYSSHWSSYISYGTSWGNSFTANFTAVCGPGFSNMILNHLLV